MRRLTAPLTAICLCLAAGTAYAAPVTLAFSGNIDLSAYGASATSTFEGTLTWESTAAPFFTGVNFADFSILSATVIVNGVDHSAAVDAANSRIEVAEAGLDAFGFFLPFSPHLDVGGLAVDIRSLSGNINGPTTMFSTFTSLPTNLGFLASATGMLFTVRDQNFDNTTFTTNVTVGPPAAPEPALMLLVGAGLAAAGLRRRKSNRSVR